MLVLLVPGVGMKGVTYVTVVASNTHRRRVAPIAQRRRRRRKYGFKITTKQRLRLNGIDTPEKGQPGFNEAKEWLTKQILNQQVIIRTAKVSKFGYYLADISLGSISINESLLRLNLARSYGGGTKTPS